jgi:non-canonical (house-cleaning) NTP pyrophosphatase
MSNQILCVNKSNRENPCERITHIGGINPNGQRWRVTQQEAIVGIETGRFAFHVRVAYRDVKVIVATDQDGHKYIKPETDGAYPENLLNLPECPG